MDREKMHMEDYSRIARLIKRLQKLQNASTRTLDDEIGWQENKHYLESSDDPKLDPETQEAARE